MRFSAAAVSAAQYRFPPGKVNDLLRADFDKLYSNLIDMETLHIYCKNKEKYINETILMVKVYSLYFIIINLFFTERNDTVI